MDAALAGLIGVGIGAVGGFVGNAWTDARRRAHEVDMDERKAERESRLRWLNERLPRYQNVIESCDVVLDRSLDVWADAHGGHDTRASHQRFTAAVNKFDAALEQARILAGDDVLRAANDLGLYVRTLDTVTTNIRVNHVARKGDEVLKENYEQRVDEAVAVTTRRAAFVLACRAELRA